MGCATSRCALAADPAILGGPAATQQQREQQKKALTVDFGAHAHTGGNAGGGPAAADEVASTATPSADGTVLTVETCATPEGSPGADAGAGRQTRSDSTMSAGRQLRSDSTMSPDEPPASKKPPATGQLPRPNPAKSAAPAPQAGGPAPQADGRVTLHIYDIVKDDRVQVINGLFRQVGTGAFHAGVEIYGKEWSYSCASGGSTGVAWCRPRGHPAHMYREKVEMGCTQFKSEQVDRIIARLAKEWRGKDYDLLSRNCCHFSDALCRCLGVGSIPAWVTNLAGIGAKLRKNADKALSHVEACSTCELQLNEQFLENKAQEILDTAVEGAVQVGTWMEKTYDEAAQTQINVDGVEERLLELWSGACALAGVSAVGGGASAAPGAQAMQPSRKWQSAQGPQGAVIATVGAAGGAGAARPPQKWEAARPPPKWQGAQNPQGIDVAMINPTVNGG